MLGNGRVANRRRHVVKHTKPHEEDAMHKILGVKKTEIPTPSESPRSLSPAPPSANTISTGVGINDYFASKLKERGIFAASVMPKEVGDGEVRMGLGFSMEQEESVKPTSMRTMGGMGFVKAEDRRSGFGVGGLGFVKAGAEVEAKKEKEEVVMDKKDKKRRRGRQRVRRLRSRWKSLRKRTRRRRRRRPRMSQVTRKLWRML
ncbi:hypothetical protein BC829DRAFT_82745 [Chytridium lagenaria]|nr:hypothetical protein BC829DRAFT_82745 [Chytridium lagenaria]